MINSFVYNFPLHTTPHIQEYVREVVKNLNDELIYVRCLALPKVLASKINNELHHYNLPNVSQFHIFRRKHFHTPLCDVRAVHVDHNNGELVHASIVIPIDGCEKTYMYWVGGNYEKGEKMEDLIQTNTGSAVRYQTLKWTTSPYVIAEHEIVVPTLCRVDVPHDAYTASSTEYRTVATLMLANNPSFDEIISRRFGI